MAEGSDKPARRGFQPGVPHKRGPGKPFKPGQSGNPGGMHKDTAEMRALCRALTAEAIKTLEQIMLAGESEGSRVQAAQAILDRAWGKPVTETEQRIAMVRELERMSDEQLKRLMNIAGGSDE